MSAKIADDAVVDAPRRQAVVLTMVAGAVIVAALYYGQDLLVPLVLAALLAFVLAPACALFERLRLPRAAAVIIVVVLASAAIGLLGLVVGRQVSILADNLPSYHTTVAEKWSALTDRFGVLTRYTRQVTEPDAAAKGAHGDEASALGLFPTSGLSLARALALPLLGPLGTAGVVIVFTIFILISSEDLRDRLVRLGGRRDLHRTILAMNDAAHRLSRYFVFQLGLNTGFGVVVGACLWFAGLPNALLWGILAGLMRFVPYVGVFIAVVPPLLLAVAVDPGWTLSVLVLALFVIAELVTGQVIEPLLYGHSTGLAPLAIIVATAFWALLWGPVGLLIATPLTVCLVVIGRHVETLAFIDVMLGDKPPLTAPETFYQRALEQHSMALLPAARKRIATASTADYYDKVALPGLALAQADLARDALAFERLDQIHAEVEALLRRLDEQAAPAGHPSPGDIAMPPRWRDQDAIVCIPGRGQLDDLTAAMAVRVLRQEGFGASVEPNLVLGASADRRPSLDAAGLCCLCVLEEGSTAAGVAYFIRRIRKRMPRASIVVGLWHAERDSAMLVALRAAGSDAHIVLSIGELVAFCRALAARANARPVAAATVAGPVS